MPFIIVGVVLAILGLRAEARVNRHQQEVANAAQARVLALGDSSCQAELQLAVTDSARATIIDGCANRIRASQRPAHP